MNVHVDIHKLLLDAIIDDEGIKAAIIVDSDGLLITKRGNAMCLRDSADDDATATVTTGLENLYIKALNHNFMIIFFNEKLSFERIKAYVDGQVERFLDSF